MRFMRLNQTHRQVCLILRRKLAPRRSRSTLPYAHSAILKFMQRFSFLVGIVFAAFWMISGIGCSSPEAKPPASPVGVWESYSTVTTLELSATGQALMSQKGVTIEGKYSMLGDNAHVKLDFEFEPGKSTAMYGVIAGDSLSFVNLKGKRVRFVKRTSP